jgi:sulfate permease, SulP family
VERLERRGATVYLSGVRPEHRKALTAFGMLSRLSALGRVFPDTPEAIVAARAHLGLPESP